MSVLMRDMSPVFFLCNICHIWYQENFDLMKWFWNFPFSFSRKGSDMIGVNSSLCVYYIIMKGWYKFSVLYLLFNLLFPSSWHHEKPGMSAFIPIHCKEILLWLRFRTIVFYAHTVFNLLIDIFLWCICIYKCMSI